MSVMYDPDVFRRLMAPPEGSEPPGVAKGSRQQAPAQPKRMPPPPQAQASYGGQEQLPPLPPLIQQAMDAQRAEEQRYGKLLRDTAPGVSPAESRLQEMAGGLQPLRGMSGPTPTWSPPGSSYFVAGEPPDYRYLADSARYAREEGAKQDQRNAGLMAGRNTPAAMQSLAQVESAKIAAAGEKDLSKMKHAMGMRAYDNYLTAHPDDPAGASLAYKEATDTFETVNIPPPGPPSPAGLQATGGPPPTPSGEFKPSPPSVSKAMSTYNVIPKAGAPGAGVSTDINARGLVDMLMAENKLRNQYPEVARQALIAGLPEGNVLMPTQRELVRLANAAMPDGADEYQAGPYTVRRTKTGSTASFDPRTGAPVSGGGVVTGYNIFGPGLDQGIWHSRGVLSDPMGPPLFSTDKSRGDANERASLLANVLQQLMLQRSRMAPPPNAAPPK